MRPFAARIALVLALLLGAPPALRASPTGDSPLLGDGRPLVVVSIAPLEQIVRRLAGESVELLPLVPAGADVEGYAPSPREMARLARAALVFEIGHSAVLIERRQLRPFLDGHPEVGVVRLSDHADPALDRGDPHLWVSARIVRRAAAELARELEALLPADADAVRARARALDAELQALDRELGERFAHAATRSFLVFHPALGALAHDYGLEQVAIEHEGKEPSPARMARTIEWARRTRVGVILVQRGLSTRAAEVVAREIGARTVEIDPLDGDWFGALRRIGAALEVALGHG